MVTSRSALPGKLADFAQPYNGNENHKQESDDTQALQVLFCSSVSLSGSILVGKQTVSASSTSATSRGNRMKALLLVGVLLVALGIVSFFVPIPHSEHHGVNLGDAHVGITTETDEKVSPVISTVLVVVGAGLMIAGRKG